MKYRVIYTAVIALALSSQLVNAGSISDTYSLGQPFTTTILNNIKIAVNDNDSKVDKDTTYTAGTGITINGTTISTTATTATTGYYYITGSELEPVENTDDTQWNAYDLTGQYAFPTNHGDKVVGHGVRLPDGSKITDMRCYYYDNDPTYNINKFDFNLYERAYLNRKFGTQITPPNDAPATTGASTTIKQLIETGLNHIVDNNNNAYYMRLRLGTDNTSYTSLDSNDVDDGGNPRADTSNLRTYGCRITYTH